MRLLSVLIFTTLALTLSSQASMNMEELANWDPPGYPSYAGLQYNDIWGWTADTGEEYAIIGNADSILILNVTECANPKRVYGFYGSNANFFWRDFKTYDNYVYAVCDSCNEGLHIFDMSALPNGDVVHVQTTTEFFSKAHNIYIDEYEDSSGSTVAKLYAVGVSGATDVIVLDISTDPEDPSLLANVNFNDVTGSSDNYYVHDAYIRQDTAYCSHGSDESLIVWDMSDLNNIEELGYLNTGDYNHSSWVDESGEYAYFAEEVPQGRPMGIIDLANLGSPTNDIEFVDDFVDPIESSGNPTPHNPFVRGDYLYISYYEDGTKVYDITDRENPLLLAYYDTHPDNNGSYSGTNGNWGTYPYFESGCIVSSDDQYGLFTLQVDYGLTDTHTPEVDIDDAIIATGCYQASNHIRSTGGVSGGNDVTLKGKFSVTMNEGFCVEAGSTFEAKIEDY